MNTTCAVERDLCHFEEDTDYAESRDDAINDRALDLVLTEFSPTDKDNFDDALGEVICDDALADSLRAAMAVNDFGKAGADLFNEIYANLYARALQRATEQVNQSCRKCFGRGCRKCDE